MANDRHEWFLNQIFRHGAPLHRYLRRFTSGSEDIEYLVQETYVRIHAIEDRDAVASPRALLFRIAHNLAPRGKRGRRRQTYSYIGLRYSDPGNAQVLPSYQTLDAGIISQVGDHFEVRLQGSNLTNELGVTEQDARAAG